MQRLALAMPRCCCAALLALCMAGAGGSGPGPAAAARADRPAHRSGRGRAARAAVQRCRFCPPHLSRPDGRDSDGRAGAGLPRRSVAGQAAKLIDELLASPAFVRHMTITLDVMLMERRRDKTSSKPWLEYLYKSLADDKPLDQLFRELIAARRGGCEHCGRPPGSCSTAMPSRTWSRATSAGWCSAWTCNAAQCHDHPLIDDYYQDDYYGLFAFVQRTSLFTDAKSKQLLLSEKADGEASFKSVFTGDGSDKAPAAAAQGGRAVRRADVRQGRGILGQARQERPRRAQVQPAGGAGRDGCRAASSSAATWPIACGPNARPRDRASGRFSLRGQSAGASGVAVALGRRAESRRLQAAAAPARAGADAGLSAVVRCAAAGDGELCRRRRPAGAAEARKDSAQQPHCSR